MVNFFLRRSNIEYALFVSTWTYKNYMVFVEETPKYKLLPINSLIAEIPITKHETLKI